MRIRTGRFGAFARPALLTAALLLLAGTQTSPVGKNCTVVGGVTTCTSTTPTTTTTTTIVEEREDCPGTVSPCTAPPKKKRAAPPKRPPASIPDGPPPGGPDRPPGGPNTPPGGPDKPPGNDPAKPNPPVPGPQPSPPVPPSCTICRAQPPSGWRYEGAWLLGLLNLLLLLLLLCGLVWALARRRAAHDDPVEGAALPLLFPSLVRGGDAVGKGDSRDGFAFAAGDRQLLDFIAARDEELRRVLCTLARMGVAWRRAEPERAASWLLQLESHPFYKGGQTLFDLLEWEDFMLDGVAAIAAADEVGAFLARIAAMIGLPAPNAAVTQDLPVLEPGFYLYRDVVLGAVAAAVATFPRP